MLLCGHAAVVSCSHIIVQNERSTQIQNVTYTLKIILNNRKSKWEQGVGEIIKISKLIHFNPTIMQKAFYIFGYFYCHIFFSLCVLFSGFIPALIFYHGLFLYTVYTVQIKSECHHNNFSNTLPFCVCPY